jgi:hypothetical protein
MSLRVSSISLAEPSRERRNGLIMRKIRLEGVGPRPTQWTPFVVVGEGAATPPD